MINERVKITGSGRRPKLRVHPANVVFSDVKDELAALMQIYGLSMEQAIEHRLLAFDDTIYITQYARVPCDYQVIVRRHLRVPQQRDFGGDVAMVIIRRIDGRKGPFEWDDMMEIKDYLFGNEAEGFELFPARSRAIHGESQFRYMWVFPGKQKIPVGFLTQPEASGASVTTGQFEL